MSFSTPLNPAKKINIARLAALGAAAALVLGACLSNTTSSQTFVKPPDPPDLAPFISTATKLVTSPWAATYVVEGTDVTSSLQVVSSAGRAFVGTNVGGLNFEFYMRLAPLTVTACVNTTGVDIACFDASSLLADDASEDGSATPASNADADADAESSSDSDSGGVSIVDTVTGLVNVPGTRLVDEAINPPGAEATCLISPKTPISNTIKLCLAQSGGLLFYGNGKVTLQATSFTNQVDASTLIPPPPGGGLADAL